MGFNSKIVNKCFKHLGNLCMWDLKVYSSAVGGGFHFIFKLIK